MNNIIPSSRHIIPTSSYTHALQQQQQGNMSLMSDLEVETNIHSHLSKLTMIQENAGESADMLAGGDLDRDEEEDLDEMALSTGQTDNSSLMMYM
jgi:hypothetical protein